MLTRGLLFKGLAAGAAIGGLGVAIHQRKNIASLLSPSSGKKKVWGELECGEADGSECSIKQGGKILIKKEGSNSFELTTLGSGKIKVYKAEDSTYSEGFKFIIEDNDINGTDPNKLEEFESYEIKLGTNTDEETLKGKHYLSRKTDAKTGIKNALGLPNENCNLPDNDASQDCSITTENIKNIKFKEGTAAVSGGTVTLTISKESSKTEFPLGYKFTFKNTVDTSDATLTIGGTSITLKKDSPVDFKIKKEGSSLSLEKAWTLEELSEKVGLSKDGDFWNVGGTGLNVKVDNSTKKEKIAKYSDSQGRIKVYSDQAGYREGLKFTIEKGDLKLMDYDSNGSTKELYLGQFQSFEIVKEENTWYLSKKDEGLEKIKNDLGLPCDLPTSQSSQECTLSTENIKAIKFDGKGNATPTVTGTPKLTISKESGRLDFPLGYKFVFSSESDASITISTSPESKITLKNDLSYEYKIKRSGDNNQTLTLEKAWTPESLMVGAAGFAKGSDNVWTDAGEEGISIKQDSNKASSAKVNGNKNAKIRVYEEVPGYNQGFKFMVEDGDTDLTDTENKINKLSKYETYEVIKDTDKQWYFNRKKKSEESIRELLGLPQDCSMPTVAGTPAECTLNDDDSKLKAIKFEGKGENEVTVTGSGTVKLKISKETSSTELPLGYKFTFSSDSKNFTIPKSGGNIEVKKNTNTEFKIKETGSTLTLEKAWTAESLGKKVNLICTSTGGNTCTFGNNINVWEAEDNYVDEATITSPNNKKLTYELDQEGYNQGIKFSVEGEENITISGTSGGTTKPSTISKKNGDTPTYEIVQKTVGGSTKWYLVKK